MRLAIDTGGTFTDLVIEDVDRRRLYKRSTTPANPLEGVLNVLDVAAADRDCTTAELLGDTDLLIYATTRAINAVITETAARTALLTTEGHSEILVFREGGRSGPFNHRRFYPPPYVPRHLTWEVPERIRHDGSVLRPLDEAAVRQIIDDLAAEQVEAVAVCLLWSIANAAHELRIGELLSEHLPDVPFTLSHQLNPTIREYRRASAAAIDASLKPTMAAHLAELESTLRAAGLASPVVMVTSSGGLMQAASVAAAPIHAIMSGPAMGPIAGRHHAATEAEADSAIITDAGGTSYDVSLVRRGRIPRTRETWLGPRFTGHMTGFPSVDVRSIGAGGGSIAWVDDGGMLHVGPDSAGAQPGPACYGRGGERPTVTDAALVLGYLDPRTFLAGAMALDTVAAERSIERFVAAPLSLDLHHAAAAVLEVTTEQMVHAIEELTVNQGIDPHGAVLVGGGGAAGLNSVAVGRRLGSPRVLFPATGAALSAAGALVSDLVGEFATTLPTTTADFAYGDANRVLADLRGRGEEFLARVAESHSGSPEIEYFAEARYQHQVWELELPLRAAAFEGPGDVDALVADFHELHKEVFEIDDPASAVELLAWRARANYRLDAQPNGTAGSRSNGAAPRMRSAYFETAGLIEVPVHALGSLPAAECLSGPAIIDAGLMTIVLPPQAIGRTTHDGGVLVDPWGPTS
ncbi:MAG TPA: hydantoinase/oxoprolinase family protein [Solirubrobacteraceae bacterium]|jgi:N-methylhydantoinase A|nr:hydantoinase/oxoprolinase family protein [Solirubrobacteraceae bacterium]